MKVQREGHNVFPEFNRYSRIIKAAPGFKTIIIYNFDTFKETKTMYKRLKSWSYKVVTQARDEKGRFAKGFVIICCR